MFVRNVIRSLVVAVLACGVFSSMACNEPQEQMMTGDTQQHPMDQEGIDSQVSE